MRMTGDKIREQVQLLVGDHITVGHFDEINNAYEKILRKNGAWDRLRVYDETSIEIKKGITTYTIPWDRIRRLEEIWVNDPDEEKDWLQVLPASQDTFEGTAESYRTPSGTDDESRPRRFRIHEGDANQLEVTPTPDGTYACRLVYQGNPPLIGSRTFPLLPALYHHTLVKLAAVYVLMQRPDDISMEKAKFWQRDFDDDLLPMANDLAPNRAGRVRTPKQRLMRA